jgi:DNA-directed RNA polymerase specialized sigma24 family protein
VELAWDAFLTRYRRLIFASIRHYSQDYDEGMDLFAHVCEKLRAHGMQRLRTRAGEPHPTARFSTWLVSVVRHLVIDWFRHRDGRHRLSSLAQGLSPLQRQIFQLVFLDHRSHAETYEVLRAGSEPSLTFREFLAALRESYRTMTGGRRGQILRELGSVPPHSSSEDDPEGPAEAGERHDRLEQALAGLPPEDRLAVELYVLEDLPADRVASILGLPNAKAVYNRVYRVLGDLRAHLEQAGIRRGDL